MLYDENETMKMLGQQRYCQVLNNDRRRAFNDMLNARLNNGYVHYVDTAMDAFMLGYIYGKREERARRKGKKNE